MAKLRGTWAASTREILRRKPWEFQTQYIRNVVERIGVKKNNLVPASASLDLRLVSDEDPAVDANYREMVGSLMWIANQTRPSIANAVRAVVRFSHDPRGVHMLRRRGR